MLIYARSSVFACLSARSMGRMCDVYGCGNHSSKKKSGISRPIHKFPDDPKIRRAWVNFVKRNRKDFTTPTLNQGICALHFYPSAFADEFTGFSTGHGNRGALIRSPSTAKSIFPPKKTNISPLQSPLVVRSIETMKVIWMR